MWKEFPVSTTKDITGDMERRVERDRKKTQYTSYTSPIWGWALLEHLLLPEVCVQPHHDHQSAVVSENSPLYSHRWAVRLNASLWLRPGSVACTAPEQQENSNPVHTVSSS